MTIVPSENKELQLLTRIYVFVLPFARDNKQDFERVEGYFLKELRQHSQNDCV
jgi:hypothetical protein